MSLVGPNPVWLIPDWRCADAYAVCDTLSREQWAWEFLRRNPAYQRDYAQFIALWRALEAAYGAPPNRDFTRWQADPRAYGPLPDSPAPAAVTGELCTLDGDERVLLECWMGAKWGFYKFPLAPEVFAPTPEQLTWRPAPPAAPRAANDPLRLDLSFDLALPLGPQLDAARVRLASRLAEVRRAGHTPDSDARRSRWIEEIRLLDAAGAGASAAAMAAADLDPEHLPHARARAASGYRELVR